MLGIKLSRFTKPLQYVAVASLLSSTLVGCAAATEETIPAGQATAGEAQTLTVLVEGGGKAQLEPVVAAFLSETGVQVELVELPYAGLYDRIQSELSTGAVTFDVAALDAIWLSAFAQGMTPLNDLMTDSVKADLFPGLVSEAQVDGQFVGMPVWTNAEIIFYRTDLWEDPKEQADFLAAYGYELKPPTTWQEFTDMAEFFTRDTDGDGAIDLYGTDVKGAVETEWLATVSQAGEDNMIVDLANREVTIDSAEHLAALDFYTSLMPFSPEGSAAIDWGASQNLFYQGSTAMIRFWGHAYTGTPEDSVVFGKVGAAPMIAGPGGVGAVPGAWYLSIPTATPKQELASQFIQFAYDNNELSMQSWLGLASRISAFESQSSTPGKEHYQALLATLDAPQTLARPASPKWQEIVDSVLVPMMQKAVVPGANNAELLRDAKAQIESILGY